MRLHSVVIYNLHSIPTFLELWLFKIKLYYIQQGVCFLMSLYAVRNGMNLNIHTNR